MRELSIDIETYGEVDLPAAGAYRYAYDAEVMLLAFSFDFADPVCVDLMSGEDIPAEVVLALFDPAVRKTAHNAAFERCVLHKYFERVLAGGRDLARWDAEVWDAIEATGGYLPVEQWRCTQVLCARAGYPLSLDEASKAMGLVEKKDPRGAALIRQFSIPCAPTKANGFRTRNLPEHDPEAWLEFIEYCEQDVRTEQAIAKFLDWFPIPEQEHRYWHINERMNERGLRVNMELVRQAISMSEAIKAGLLQEAAEITGLDNPNSRNQLLEWLNEEGDVEADALRKEDVSEMLSITEDDAVRRVLEIRQEAAKSSVSKYAAMERAACPDLRIRGTVQFGGAPRTLRDAGRIIQPQNLPRISLRDADLELARNLAMDGDRETLEMLFGPVQPILGQLIRTAIIPEEGKRLLVCDLASIESRVLAWLAGEDWKLDVFFSHGKIYEATASRMFGVPFDSITKESEMRQRGKVAELACGYGGSVNALTQMDFEKGIPDEAKPGLVRMYRKSNPKIVAFWSALESAALKALHSPGVVFKVRQGVAFCAKKNVLLLKLPSGRLLHYPKPHLTTNRWGNESIGFYGMAQQSRKWSRLETYGGKLAENVTQAVARDVLMNGLEHIVRAGYHPILKVHDEIVCEEPYGFGDISEMEQLMCAPADWMEGLPLDAEGFEGLYYKK